MWLVPRVGSIGLRMYRSTSYSTWPAGFLGARAMLMMPALRGSAGSTSPWMVPTSFWYCPIEPKERPSKVGDSSRVILIRVIPAFTACGSAMTSASNQNPLLLRHRSTGVLYMVFPFSRLLVERDKEAVPGGLPGTVPPAPRGDS